MSDIDKVAEAIWGQDRCRSHRCPRKAFGWDNLDERTRTTYRRMAEAALEAARTMEDYRAALAAVTVNPMTLSGETDRVGKR